MVTIKDTFEYTESTLDNMLAALKSCAIKEMVSIYLVETMIDKVKQNHKDAHNTTQD